MTAKKAVSAEPQARSQPRYFIGIDGGGTGTTAWLADEYGHVCARAEAAASNPLKTGIAASQKELVDAALGALRKAGVGAREVAALCAGVAGVDRSPVRRKIITALRSAISAPHFLLTTDAAITLQSAFGKEPGVVVISGTGSIAYGRDRSGRTVRVGGWGSVFDDAGSGYDLGRKAVAAALNDMDGCGPKTALREALSKTLKLRSIAQVAGREWTPGEIAALFPVMLEVARRGDRVAQGLCREAGRDLAGMSAALLKQLDLGRSGVPVICAGGVFTASASVRRSFAWNLRRLLAKGKSGSVAGIKLLRREPVEGALELALELGKSRD